MTLSFLFWLLMLLWVLFSFWWGWRTDAAGRGTVAGTGLLLFLLLLIVGLKIFGSPIRG
jgi:hypothetical protein